MTWPLSSVLIVTAAVVIRHFRRAKHDALARHTIAGLHAIWRDHLASLREAA